MATLSQARMEACRRWPYGSAAVLSLVPVERKGLGTCSVDAHWRVYYDPDYLAGLSVGEAAGVVLHEVSHLLMAHHRRAEGIVDATNHDNWRLWNAAADYAVNHNLQAESILLPEGVLLPASDGLPLGLSAEAYYRLLLDKREQEHPSSEDDNQQEDQSNGDSESGESGEGDSQPDGDDSQGGETGESDGEGGGAGDDSEQPDCEGDDCGQPSSAQPGEGGSCADGQQRPWELGPPEESGVEGIQEHEADILRRQVAEKILDKQRGEGRGGMGLWAQSILRPKVDPKTALLRAVRKAVDAISGIGDYSYRRPSRRSTSDMVRPGNVQPVPRITIIVDTSGSMDKHDIGLCLGLVGKVVNSLRLRDGVKVMCGDCGVETVAARVFDPKKIILSGGGGTDMSLLIREAAEQKPKPQLIVVATDGETPWGEPVGVPVVAAVTRESSFFPIPSWITKVVLN